jgi:hypothetical protein
MPALAVFSKKLPLLSVRKLSFQIDAGTQYTQTDFVNKGDCLQIRFIFRE